MSSPASPLHPPENGGSTPTTKTKEKKRVGFSAGDGTPLKEEIGFSWETPQPGLSAPATSTTAQTIPPVSKQSGTDQHGSQAHSHSDADVDADQGGDHSHDGVDHKELTRALSLILQEEGRPESSSSSSKQTTQQPPQIQLPNRTYFPSERQQQSERAAKERADRLAQSVERANSTPVSRATSIDGDSDAEEDAATAAASALHFRRRRRTGQTNGNGDPDGDAVDLERGIDASELDQAHATALRLVRSHTVRGHGLKHPGNSVDRGTSGDFQYDASLSAAGGRSGTSTPTVMFDGGGHEYVPPPSRYHGGVLSSLLKLYNNNSGLTSGNTSGRSTPAETPASSRPPSPNPQDGPGSSGTLTPNNKRLSGIFGAKHGKSGLPGPPGQPWKNQKHASSTTSLSAGLLGTSSMLASAGSADIGQAVTERVKRERPGLKRNRPSGSLFGVGPPKLRKEGGSGGGGNGNGHHGGSSSGRRRREEEIRITVHIAHVLSRHRYLTKLCRALMMYGAPTHRLEDYLKMSSRVLEIEAQFLYIPGCMLVSFDDSSTHTAEVKLVRAPQGVDLGKLREVHGIYKEVVHDLISVDEASSRLEAVMGRRPKFNSWIRVPVYGLASVCVAPFAFQGRFIDLPVAFVLGCIVGLLALVAAPHNAMYANVFEISAAVITSFLARAAGSIDNGKMFCFSALAQSSIALILPGYMVLCSSLELQSQSIVAGSVRMIYAMIYTLFLGYGITIGSAVYGAIDSGATSATSCTNALSRPWYFLFVPLFTLCLCIINQAKWKQVPIMLAISVAGFAVNTYASMHFSSNAQIPNTLGALCIGVFANLYARLSRYFERFFLLLWAGYLEPVARRLKGTDDRRGRRRWRAGHWHGINSHPSSREQSRNPVGQDDFFDMPPYNKRLEGEGADMRAATATATAPAPEPASESPAETGAGPREGNEEDEAAARNRPTDRSEAVAAGVAAEAAAAAAAERKAPGSAEVMGYGLAAAAMLPAIFVQVPSGLAVNGSLLSGISAADQLTGNSSITAGGTVTSSTNNSVAFSVLYSVIEVAIGITVGLFLSALIVYPLGKRRSALFSF
ncbi:duf1212 domain containing protein [Grosmannia clavigera kw1407]|uniref:Duf1212 domain containing protein n=1 Tax=Grosmannia clavigera (strain kw1407 / UAMH 11150) TaxID=655863 RepID=F0XJH2_GROCL|nr:duf1212 domain containing protein [Grosmannia clavigera kw1407]EFX02065.1 duf1212 domain containing protein [Grosmannia clavigera kw1407]